MPLYNLLGLPILIHIGEKTILGELKDIQEDGILEVIVTENTASRRPIYVRNFDWIETASEHV